MPKRSLASQLNNASKMAGIDTTSYKPVRLDPEQLIPSMDNFYHVSEEDVEELADSMLHSGLIEPIIVARVDGHDRIVSGHRRREAALLNKRRGYEEFNEVNCMMREMTQNMFMITLASANAFTRKLTDFELIKQAEILRTYYQKAKEEDGLEIKGKMRDFLAAQLGVSKTKMAQIDAINNNLSEEGKQALEAGNINFSKAYETSKLPPEQQQEVIKNRTLLSQDVKDLAQQNRKTANISFQMKEETECVEEETFTMPLKKTVEKSEPNFVDRNWETMTFTDYQFYKYAIKKLEEVHPEFLSMK